MARKIRIQRKFSLTTPIDYRDLSGKKRHSGHPLERPARFDGNWRPPICAVPPFRPQAAIITSQHPPALIRATISTVKGNWGNWGRILTFNNFECRGSRSGHVTGFSLDGERNRFLLGIE